MTADSRLPAAEKESFPVKEDHTVDPPRNEGPVRYSDWPERQARTQAEIAEMVDWLKEDR